MMKVSQTTIAAGLWACVLVCPFPSTAQGFLEHLLPSWPLLNVGDAIPDDLINAWSGVGNTRMGHKCPGIQGQFRAFPSKRNRDSAKEIQDQKDKGEWDDLDPDTICDDGDQTTYNGELCAVGIAAAVSRSLKRRIRQADFSVRRTAVGCGWRAARAAIIH
jgi:hypothetical protein